MLLLLVWDFNFVIKCIICTDFFSPTIGPLHLLMKWKTERLEWELDGAQCRATSGKEMNQTQSDSSCDICYSLVEKNVIQKL